LRPMPLGPCFVRFALVVLAIAGTATPAPGRVIPGDAFLCGDAKVPRATRGAPPPPAFHARVAVPVIDRFTRPLPSGRYTVDLRRADAFCRPVRLDGGELAAPLHGIELYEARRTRRKPAPPPLPQVTEVVESAFGTVRLKVGSIATLAVPTMATGSVGGGGNVERDHYACYAGRPERVAGERLRPFRSVVRTVDGPRTVDVRKPIGLCVPASVREDDPSAPKHPVDLLCWDARVVPGDDAPAPAAEVVATRNGFGPELLKVAAPRVLCVPAARLDVTVPTPTPFATFTPPPTPVPSATAGVTPRPAHVRIEPPALDGLLRDRQCFTAWSDLPNGTTADVTATAIWRVFDNALAVPSGFVDGKKCFVGIAIGATAITARDPSTGATSAAASLTSTWPIFQLVVTPKQIGMRPGDTETLTVTAHLLGDRTRNVTQHVRYESSNPAIASMPNVTGNRSRIDAAGTGSANIFVHDTFSSFSDAASVAVGNLVSIEVEPGPLLFPGETAKVKAIGLFAGGFRGNVTSVSTFTSSAPNVVLAPNTPGDRGRIEAIAPGRAVVDATDGPSGIRSTCCGTVRVLGDALDVTLAPNLFERRLGIDTAPLFVTATGLYAIPPNGSASRAVSGHVAWSSSDQAVVAIGDVDARERRELLVVGGGQASVVATDPSNGFTSAPVTVTIFDVLDRVDVGTSPFEPAENQARTITVGQSVGFYAHGYFDGGRYSPLKDFRLVSSDPSVVLAGSGRFVTGLKAGTVTISAVDHPSGVSSADGGRDGILHVIGGIERIALSPPTVDLDVGQATSLTTIGYDANGGTENVTQRVFYSSSNPNVVVAENATGNQSRISAVGSGSATISAYDPVSGLSTSTTGDDAVVVVHDDSLVRIVVAPTTVRLAVESARRFTATGHRADGTTVNLTQRVEWSVDDSAVATAPNAAGDRSRVVAVGPGTTTVDAYDPGTGVRASDSGEHATLAVAGLSAIELSPAEVTLTVGQRFSLTALGRLDDDGIVNLTQDATYATSDPAVVAALNTGGNRSQIEAIAPGVATITASRASSYPQATESAPVTIIVTGAE
jgi:hypothetical protein